MTRRATRIGTAIAALVALWLVAVFGVVPWIIRSAHAGRSLPALNRLIAGAGQHPVQDYLVKWRQLALLGSAAAVAGMILAALVYRYRATLARRARSIVRSPPMVGLADTALIGACLGFASGLVDAIAVLVHLAVTADPLDAPDPRIIWMAPLAGALAGALGGLVLGTLLGARRGLALRVPVGLFCTGVMYSLIIGLRLHLHWAAVLLLAAGISIRLAGWTDGRGDSFRTAVRRAAPWLAAAIALTAAGLGGAAWIRERRAISQLGAARANTPNVLVLLLDTVRSQSLSLYGYGRRTSPALEHRAASGVVFDMAIVPAPWTLPTHASLFTGLPPHALTADFHKPLDRTAPTLAEVLSRHGYATAAFVANLEYASRATGLDRGFAVYRDHPLTLNAVLASARWSAATFRLARRMLGDHRQLVRKTAADVNREFLAWQSGNQRPFFAFLNYFDAHTPYETQPPFDTLFSTRPPRYWLYPAWTRFIGPVDENTAGYDACIAYLDDQLGQLLAELERRGTLDNTLLIIVGDHGEHLGEHGIFNHANSMYLPLLRVPLIISSPRLIPSGRRVAAPVAVQDLAATILDVTGLAATDSLPGRSLRGYWADSAEAVTRAAAGEQPGPLSELSFNDFADRRDPIRRGPMLSLVQGRLHYIRNGDGVEELYDILADPDERRDLSKSAPDSAMLSGLRQAMQALRDQRR